MAELIPQKAPEEVPVVANADGSTRSAVVVAPTQMRRPWRSTFRTVFQGAVALATLVPFVVSGIYDGSSDYPAAIAQLLTVSATVTRVMAIPQVELFLRRFLPWLAAAPKVPPASQV